MVGMFLCQLIRIHRVLNLKVEEIEVAHIAIMGSKTATAGSILALSTQKWDL